MNTTAEKTKKPTRDKFKFERLARAFGQHLKDRGEQPLWHNKRFYTYRGNCYVEETELCERLRKFMASQEEAQSNNVVGNVIPIIQAAAHRGLTQYGAMPFYVGTAPFKAENVIAYRNGLLDMAAYRNGRAELIPHTPDWISTVCLPFDFDPTAQCPQWLRFLAEVYEEDSTRVQLLQEYCGYCLTQDASLAVLLQRYLNSTINVFPAGEAGRIGENWEVRVFSPPARTGVVEILLRFGLSIAIRIQLFPRFVAVFLGSPSSTVNSRV